MANNFTPIEKIVNIFDPNIRWLAIKGFNGYQVSTTGIIRSMKHYKKYPYGILVKPSSSVNSSDPVYELSDDNNNRVRIHYSELANLANNFKEIPPCSTMVTNYNSRNKFVKNEEGAYKKVYNGRKAGKAKYVPKKELNNMITPKFTIVADTNNE